MSNFSREKEYRELLSSRGASEEYIENAQKYVREYIDYLHSKDITLDNSSLEDVKQYVKNLMETGRNTVQRINAVCMYINTLGYLDQYLYLAEMVGGAPLYQSYHERTKEIAGEETAAKIFDTLELPPIGTSAEGFPEYTREMMRRMQSELSEEQRVKILAGNHHKRSPKSFDEKKQLYTESENLDEFLRKDHEHIINVLEEHMREGRLWYRKKVTQEFLDYIKADQERLSARREGDTLIIKQIPYEFEDYMTETDPTMRRHHFCHCHLARRSILEGDPVPSEFCHCSGGYLKQPYDHIFGEELEVKVLQSAMAGDDECRFSVKLPKDWKGKES